MHSKHTNRVGPVHATQKLGKRSAVAGKVVSKAPAERVDYQGFRMVIMRVKLSRDETWQGEGWRDRKGLHGWTPAKDDKHG